MAPESSGQGQTDGIAALLAQAQADFAALRLTAPAGDNALEKYRKVLDLAPDNAAAKQGLQGIADHFVGLAQQTTAAGDLNEASEYLRQAAAIVPDAPNIALAKNELALKLIFGAMPLSVARPSGTARRAGEGASGVRAPPGVSVRCGARRRRSWRPSRRCPGVWPSAGRPA